MTPDKRVAMQAVKIKSADKMLQFMKAIYLQGFADGADAEVADDDDRYLRIKLGSVYECECPECHTLMELDLVDLLRRGE